MGNRVEILAGVALVLLSAVLSFSYYSSDFLGFYAGAKLGPTGAYDHVALDRLEKQYGFIDRPKPFHRPPFYLAALRPLAWFPYNAAFFIWQSVNVSAWGLFVWIWPAHSRRDTILLSVWHLPVWLTLLIGQDATLILAAFALAVRISERFPFSGGVVLSLCCVKANLFLALPVVLVGRRMWRLTAGLVSGGAILYVLSAWSSGLLWVMPYLSTLLHTTNVLRTQFLFANDLVAMVPGSPPWLQWPLLLGIVYALMLAVRRTSERQALALSAMAGVLISPLAFVYDATLFLPGIIGMADRSRRYGLIGCVLSFATWTIAYPALAWIGHLSMLICFLLAVRLELGRHEPGTPGPRKAAPARPA